MKILAVEDNPADLEIPREIRTCFVLLLMIIECGNLSRADILLPGSEVLKLITGS